MKEDDMAEKKRGSSKHALDFRGGERGGGNEKEKSVFFLAACFQWQIVNDICKTEGSDKVKRSWCAN